MCAKTINIIHTINKEINSCNILYNEISSFLMFNYSYVSDVLFLDIIFYYSCTFCMRMY